MKLFFCSSVAALLIGLCGCCAAAPDSDRACFDRIAKDLETGGSSYVVSSDCNTWATCEQLIKEIEKIIWDSSYPAERKRQMQRFVSQFELSSRALGLHEIKGWGFSSKRMRGNNALFRNKARVLSARAPQGAAWNIFAQQNIDLLPYFCNIPADTYAAGALNLNPAAIEKFLNSEKQTAATFRQLCQLFLQMPPEKLLKNTSGVWRFVIICDEENDTKEFSGFYAALTIPDKEGKIFNTLASKFKVFSGIQIDPEKKSIKFPKIQGYNIAPFVRGDKESITLYTTPAAHLRIQNRTVAPEALKAFSKQLPSAGVAAFYLRNAVADLSPSGVDSVTENPSWQVIERLEDGFLSTDLSPCDMKEYFLRAVALLPVQMLFEIFAEQPPSHGGKQIQVPPVRKAKPQPKVSGVTRNQCTAAIKRSGETILSAAAARGSWPPAGISGLRELVKSQKLDRNKLACPLVRHRAAANQPLSYANCHYLYFGKPAKDSPKSPILMELPFLHKEYFAVFYAEGKVEKIYLSGQRSARRAISYLHTRHSYEEEEFMRLMQLAGEFDKILER